LSRNSAAVRWLQGCVLAALAGLSGCTSTGTDGRFSTSTINHTPPLPAPAEYRFVPPRKDLDPKIAAFWGQWQGMWIYPWDQLEHVLVVETLSENTFSAVYSVGDSVGQFGNTKRRWRRIYGVAAPGRLVTTTYVDTRPIVTTYVLRDDGSLSATYDPHLGPVSVARMVKVPAGKVSRPD